MVEVGMQAPAFNMEGAGGEAIRLDDFAGRKLVLYFYPKDNTSGCTRQANEFTAEIEAFAKADTVVVGVSKDSVKSHDNFIAKHDLKVLLGSDPDGKVIEAYGAWVEKNMYGRKYMGIERSTFLIDRNGKVAEVWRKVRVAGHVDKVLQAAQALD